MLDRKIVATIFLGLITFGIISKVIIREHEKIDDEPARNSTINFYLSNSFTISGTASTVAGSDNFIKLV